MKLVAQRVKQAKVLVEGNTVGSIDQGILVLLGIHKEDTPEKTPWFVNKLLNLRIFEDSGHKMNLSVQDIKGEAQLPKRFLGGS